MVIAPDRGDVGIGLGQGQGDGRIQGFDQAGATAAVVQRIYA